MDGQIYLKLTKEELYALYQSNTFFVDQANEYIRAMKDLLDWSKEEKESRGISDDKIMEEVKEMEFAVNKLIEIQGYIEEKINQDG